MLALHDDAEEPEAAEEEAEREYQGTHDTLPWLERSAICPHNTDAEHRHAEAPAARRPRVTGVQG